MSIFIHCQLHTPLFSQLCILTLDMACDSQPGSLPTAEFPYGFYQLNRRLSYLGRGFSAEESRVCLTQSMPALLHSIDGLVGLVHQVIMSSLKEMDTFA